MFDAMGPFEWEIYFFFASMMICCVTFVFFVPETKSIALESFCFLFQARPVWSVNKIILGKDRTRVSKTGHDAELALSSEYAR